LPFLPRLMLGSTVLPQRAQLIDCGVVHGEPVMAEMSVVLSTSKDKTAKVWDALSGECLYTLTGHSETVCSASSAPDLKYLVTCSEDLTAKLWVVRRDVQAAMCLFTLRGHTKSVNSVSFSEDGKFIVTGSSDNTAKIWVVKTGQLQRTFEGHRGAVFAASFAPDGMSLQTQSRDSTAKRWEVETGRCTNTEPLWDQAEANSSSASDGHIIVTTGGPSIHIHDCHLSTSTKGVDKERSLEGHADDVTSVTFVDVRVIVRTNPALQASRTRALSPKAKTMGNTRKKGFGKSRSNFALTQ